MEFLFGACERRIRFTRAPQTGEDRVPFENRVTDSAGIAKHAGCIGDTSARDEVYIVWITILTRRCFAVFRTPSNWAFVSFNWRGFSVVSIRLSPGDAHNVGFYVCSRSFLLDLNWNWRNFNFNFNFVFDFNFNFNFNSNFDFNFNFNLIKKV